MAEHVPGPTETEYDLLSEEFRDSILAYYKKTSKELRKLCKSLRKKTNNGSKNLSLEEKEKKLSMARPTIEHIVGLDQENCKHLGMAQELAEEAFKTVSCIYKPFLEDYSFDLEDYDFE